MLERVFAEVTAVAVGGETRGGRSGKALIGVSADGVTRTSCLHRGHIIGLEVLNYFIDLAHVYNNKIYFLLKTHLTLSVFVHLYLNF